MRLLTTSMREAAETAAFAQQFANRADYDTLIDFDALVIGPDGQIIARLVTGCLDADLVKDTAKHFRTVHGDPSNRGSVIGPGAMMNRERKDSTLGLVKEVPKAIIQKLRAQNTFTDFLGWFDRSHTGSRFDSCRETAWSLDNPEVLEAARPFVKAVDDIYKWELPKYWQRQREFMDEVSDNYKFNDSVFSTVTVNRNLRTTYHTDRYDFEGGMGNLIVLEGGNGGELIMPKYRVAFAPQPTDVLLMNVHELHGNLAFKPERLTAVLYAREHLDKC